MRSFVTKAGVVYFAIVIAAGFVLGAIRTIGVAPIIGDTAAVLLELPLILAISFMAAGWSMQRYSSEWKVADGAAMGLVAFLLLMLAEVVLAIAVFGLTPSAHFEHWLTPAGAIGLAGQALFGAFPAIRAARR